MTGKLQFILSIDTEEEWDWNGPFPEKNAAVRNIEELPAFHAFCQEVGILPTYFVDYAVIENDRSASIINSLITYGDCEIGAHLHPWVNPPFYGNIGEKESHVINLPLEQVNEKLKVLIGAMRSRLKITPRAFRSGRWGINGDCLDLLLDCNIDIDSSVYPFFRNDYFSCMGSPVNPYWPDFEDTNREASQRKILEMPVTAGFNWRYFDLANRLHETLIKPPCTWLRLSGVFWHMHLLRKIYLSPELHSAEDMISLVKICLKRGQRQFHMNLHSSSLLEGVTGLSDAVNAREQIGDRIARLVRYLQAQSEVQFCTISSARDEWLNEHRDSQNTCR